MSAIYLQLIPRSATLQAGDTITLRFPLETTHPERDLSISAEVAPLLAAAETDYYVPDTLRDPARLPAIGQTLYRWLDGDDRFLTRALDGVRGQPGAVALLLEQGAGLEHLPWELLHDGDGYLVQGRPTAVVPVRWSPGPDRAALPQNRPLHVAFMATAPQGVAPELHFEAEEAAILTATQRHPLRLSVEESGNLQELRYLLGDLGAGAIDVVHLTGHATHRMNGPAFLCEDEVGGSHWATAQELAAALTYTPRLLFLSGCRTGQAQRGGAVPSLAAALVAQGLPAVLGWGQPVFDPDATVAAALYAGLAQGLPLVRALAETYDTLLRRQAANPQSGRHWHLLRLYARGSTPPPNFPQFGGGTTVSSASGWLPPQFGEGWGGVSVLAPLVTETRRPGRARPTIPQREAAYLDEEGRRVPVASRANFVGRRRALQSCLRALRRDAPELGVILYGLGGHGKSTLAHRLRQRWQQRSEQHGAVVLYGALDESLLLRKLNQGLAGSPAAREALNSGDTLRFRLHKALTSCTEQLLIILDNFEDNFEGAQGAPRLVDGRPLLRGATVQLLDDLCFALQGSVDGGQEHRLLITSRYRPQWREADRFYPHQLDRLNAAAVEKKVTRLPAVAATPLRERALTLADGNPRLLEWLFDLLAQEASATPDMEAVLARMAEKESALRENILAHALLAAQSSTLRQLLARGLVCELPVPAAVFAALEALATALPATAQERERATTLGLLEATITQSPNHPIHELRVPRILAPLLAAEEQPDAAQLAATAARTLYTLWWESAGADPSEAQEMELHRLALAGSETAIAQEVANALAGRWNRAEQYRYREVIDLITHTVTQGANARLWNQIGYAKNQLGEMQAAIDHYQAALSACPTDELGLQGTILNNLGSVYDALGDKAEALRYYNLALPLYQQVGDKGGEATTLNNLGSVYSALGDKAEALRYYNLALPLRQQVGDRWGESITRYNLAMVYVALGRLAKAVAELEQVVALDEAVGHPDLATDQAMLAQVRAQLAQGGGQA